MMRPPSRERDTPSRDSFGAIALALAICALPFLGGASGSFVFAREAIGPLVTLALWIAVLVIGAIRSNGGFHLFEWMTIVGCVLVLQLLLDLHTPHLGDLVVASLHVIVVIAAIVQSRRGR